MLDVTTILIIALFASFIALLMIGIPVAYALGGLSVIFVGIAMLCDHYAGTFIGLDPNSFSLVINRIFALMENWVLVALPMFIFMGHLLDRSGVAEKLMHAMQNLLGGLHGGLAVSVTVIGVLLAAATGIIGASIVLLGILSLPAMLSQGYRKELAVGTVCGAGTLGILIPPSIMLIIMADQLQLPVGSLFMGAVFPGLILALFYVLYILGYAIIRPEVAPLPENRQPLRWQDVGKLALAIVPAMFLILLVLGSIFFGVATPTESSGMGAFGAGILAAANRRFSLSVLKEAMAETLKTTGFIFAILIGATCFSLVLRFLGGDELIGGLLLGLDLAPQQLVILVLVVIFALGFFLDWIEITLIILPLVAPVLAGLDLGAASASPLDDSGLVWFSILYAVTLQTSFLTPPVGFALFYIKGVCPPGITIGHIYRGAVPFVILQLLALAVIFKFPALVTWLPLVAYR
jgi:tripartite ATP-independent transporter DctM subunit